MSYTILKLPNGQWAMNNKGDFLLKESDSNIILPVTQQQISFNRLNEPVLSSTDISLEFEMVGNSETRSSDENCTISDTNSEPTSCDNNNGQNNKHEWQYFQTLALISAVESHYDDMYHPIKKKNFWVVISGELESQQISYEPLKCKKKWENLVRTYKSAKDKKMKSGRAPTRFLFFDRLEELLGQKPNNCSPHSIDVNSTKFKAESSTHSTTEDTNAFESADSLKAPENVAAATNSGKKRKSMTLEYTDMKKNFYESQIKINTEYREKLIEIKTKKNNLYERKLQLEERKVRALEYLAECIDNSQISK